jgi:hypothetical protein
MSKQQRFLGFGLAFAVVMTAGAESASAVTYVASLLSPVGFSFSSAYGIGGSGIAGQAYPPFDESNPSPGGAALWNAATHSLVSLNPGSDWHSSAYGASNDSQVGWGSTSADPDEHALLWHGTAASFADLNPAGFYTSHADGVSGNNQVGDGGLLSNPNGGFAHALLWHGTAASVVDINPSGYVGSTAAGVLGDNIVGTTTRTGSNDQHATLWAGPSHSVVDLHPGAFADSAAFGISTDSQVGTGYLTAYFQGDRHALLWHGSAASAVDLNPTGFTQSEAFSVAGAMQVGYGMGPSTGDQHHAFLWQGTAASAIDLQALLAGLPQTFVSSEAHGIDANGVIVGFASTCDTTYAVELTPVPEPGSLTMLITGILAMYSRPRRDRIVSPIVP